jgi:hypothetical protein
VGQENLSLRRPNGWSQPQLTMFFENMWGNTIATFANKKEARRLCRIDDLWYEILTDWKGLAPTVETSGPLFMFFRSHAAYRGACSLVMSGMTVEGMAILRLCLEFAGYACLLTERPELAMVWWDRDVDEKTKQAARDALTAGAVKRAVKRLDERTGEIYEGLYDRTIQWGAHPNEKTVTQNLALKFNPGEMVIEQVYLQADGKPLDHGLRTAGQVGICALKIFEHSRTDVFVAILNIGNRPRARGIVSTHKERARHVDIA